ncbi:hypothetical protein [Mesorhizobium sp. 1B3]|uniref:hypothetical protein n=1 Tax=Mesorhizobium sp. 1B3 TaxID=3243599 RepID=UPI003D964DFE
MIVDKMRTSSDTTGSRLAWSEATGDYVIECRRHRYWKMEPDCIFSKRNLELRLYKSGETCAVAEFVEWRSGGASLLDEFVDEADMDSQADYDMAIVMHGSWRWHEAPFDYGTVVRFERLAIDTRRDAGRLAWALIQAAITREFGRRGALMLLKAFPLEYEGEVTPHRRPFFERRVRAMLRLYSRTLSAKPLPNEWGADGWMWRPLRYCPPPVSPKPKRRARPKLSHP